MRTVLAMVVAVSLVAGMLSAASAADEKKPNPQQERMKACNAQAGDKKGDERGIPEYKRYRVPLGTRTSVLETRE